MTTANGTQAQAQEPTSIRPPRMTLASITKGKLVRPRRILIHGVDGVGKSTFAACAPNTVFLGTEDGTEHLDVSRYPSPESWDDVLEAIKTLTVGEHKYGTLAIDSLDWAEPILWRHLCEKHKVKTIEEVGGGYGKGYSAALDEWRVFISAIERMQNARKMHVVLIAHSFIKPFKNPQGDDFDRYVLKLNDRAAGLLREWCRGVYFANYETFAVKDKAKRVRGVSTGARLLYTQRTAAYDAKDSYGLPEQVPLSWEEFEKAAAGGTPAELADLKAEIARKADELGGEIKPVILETLAKAGDNLQSLSIINNKLNVRIAEKKEKES